MDQVGDLVASVLQAHMDRVGIAEEIVQIAKNLLIRPGQEDPQDVRVILVPWVQLERCLPLAAAGETVDDAVGVAGHVLDRTATGRRLGQPVDRHDREELVDRPVVRQRLEEGEVAEVTIDERALEMVRDLGIRRAVVANRRGERIQRREIQLFGIGSVA